MNHCSLSIWCLILFILHLWVGGPCEFSDSPIPNIRTWDFIIRFVNYLEKKLLREYLPMVVEYLHPPSSWAAGQLRKLIYKLWVWTQKSRCIFPNQTLTASLTHTWILSSNQRPLFDLLTNQRALYDQSEASVMGSSCILLATVFLITLANTPTLVH